MKVFVESGFGRFNWPYVHTETLQKIRAAASKRKLVLMVHATSVDSWRSAVDAHADIIAHGLWVWPGDVGNPTPPVAGRRRHSRRGARRHACSADAADCRRRARDVRSGPS